MRLQLSPQQFSPLVGLLLLGQASAQSFSADFDHLPEGVIGTTYMEESLIFSDLDRYLGVSNETFVSEDASGDLAGMTGFTAPNTLGFGGYSPGAGVGYSRCGKFRITPPITCNLGEVNIFLVGGSTAGNTVTLEGRLAGAIAGSVSVNVPGSFGPHAFTLSLNGVDFDTLVLVGTGTQHSGSFFGVVDSVSAGVTLSTTAFCFGDGSGTVCPCGNTASGAQGCNNSTGLGGLMTGFGSNSVANADLTFAGSQMPANVPALCFSGATQANGGIGTSFGDGILCVAGGILRHDVRFTDGNGMATWGPGFAAANGWVSGTTRNFQIWYRDPTGPCGSGFNVSNGVQVNFLP
jgi:hypothetical protein